MITILAGIFVHEEDSPTKIRETYGMLCGLVGIFLNVVLFGGKLFAGTVCHSIAITADAFNNLSDAGSSAVTLVGFRLAGQKPDTEHPFGHGRIEYVAGLIVSAVILIMAVELIQDSVKKIIHPQAAEFSTVSAVILLASIAVKLYMSYYNRKVGEKLDSATMRATATDSLSDTAATTAVLLSMVIGHYTGLMIDGWCGALVGGFIFMAGISAAKDTLNPLLGQPPEEGFVNQISEIVTAHPGIMGIHDLVVHDYGPGRQMISLHAEVPADADILEVHDLIDRIEVELKEKLYCEAVIHMDPIVRDEATGQIWKHLKVIVKGIGEELSIHDFRMVPGKSHTNLIFDVVVPFGFHMEDEEVTKEIQRRITEEIGENYFAVMQVDKSYVK
ncbi:MAG: cation diffusion facilitator family transporter [Roseburia sp.]|nr:cation diffusion facilitator family transporter [Roseburia sp.]